MNAITEALYLVGPSPDQNGARKVKFSDRAQELTNRIAMVTELQEALEAELAYLQDERKGILDREMEKKRKTLLLKISKNSISKVSCKSPSSHEMEAEKKKKKTVLAPPLIEAPKKNMTGVKRKREEEPAAPPKIQAKRSKLLTDTKSRVLNTTPQIIPDANETNCLKRKQEKVEEELEEEETKPEPEAEAEEKETDENDKASRLAKRQTRSRTKAAGVTIKLLGRVGGVDFVKEQKNNDGNEAFL